MKFIKFFRSFDKFGEPVKVLYKGEDIYKTKMGALFSLILYSLVLVYMGMKAIQLVKF